MCLRGVYRSSVNNVRLTTLHAFSCKLGIRCPNEVTLVVVMDMIQAVLTVCNEEELFDSDDGDEDERTVLVDKIKAAEYYQRQRRIRNKIMAIGKIQRVLKRKDTTAESGSS